MFKLYSVIFSVTIFGAVFFYITPNIVSAHSGGTDSSGGHHCWTNCSSYGYSYGKYHYHNGGYSYYSTPTYSTPTYPTCPSMSSYNSLSGQCECYSGYVAGTNFLGDPTCISGSSYCTGEYGYGSQYSYLSNSCSCSSGYEWNTNFSGDATCSSCSSKYGIHSTYDYLSNSCECSSGYEFGSDWSGDLSCIKSETTSSSYYYGTTCIDNVNGYLATDGNCYCNSGYEWNTGANSCTAISYSCTFYGENISLNTTDDLCYCDSGYQWNSDKTSCDYIKPIVLGETAESPTSGSEVSQLGGQYDSLKYDASLVERLKGRILLQTEEHGEAWYIRMSDSNRYYMKDGNEAYTMMRLFSLGITDSDLSKIPSVADTVEMNNSTSVCSSNSLANNLKGEILLQVEQHGEAWYVDPEKCRAIYMKDGAAAYEIMRYLGLGITNLDLTKMPTGTIE